ncbi:MAG: hypothetical protein JWL86_6966 [Rhizobium sp.]|nr:hypothetical protein [Rhizobium sp.]
MKPNQPDNQSDELRQKLSNTLLLFAKQLRATDYNRVKKLITPEKEAIDRAEHHEYCLKEILKLLDQAKLAELQAHAAEWVTINEDGRINARAVYDRIAELQLKNGDKGNE